MYKPNRAVQEYQKREPKMPAVFVHGVPDTFHVWNQVRGLLPRTDSIALALPGFGCPVPAGFTATKEEYVDWVIAQLEQSAGPVDLVGHDWGCILTARVASLRPDLVRTWAGGSGPVSADYEWHPLAKIWQTPEVGEQWMASLNPEEFSQMLQSIGVPAALAPETTGQVDPLMKDCILRLYRSAVTVGAEWQPGLTNVLAPSLIFWGQTDPACPVEFADRLGADTHAARVVKLDCGHWTPLERPQEVADALQAHWNN